MINGEQIEGVNLLNARGIPWIYLALGHLKEGVTHSQAIADLNSIGSYLEKTYPKEHGQVRYSLSRPRLYGDFLGSRVGAFLTGLMVLAGVILLAGCAHLGGLFSARASHRARGVALPLPLGARSTPILPGVFSETFVCS